MQTIAVIDYGMGNLRSVSKALEAVAPNAHVVVSSDSAVIDQADKVVCPGQGAARDCMGALAAAGLDQVVKRCVSEKPFLGICMGMQVLMGRSDENEGINCLDVFAGSVKRFDEPLMSDSGRRLKVPHMGWSQVKVTKSHALWQGIDDLSRFYFAHSYYIVPDDASLVAARCHYGNEFAVAVAEKSLFACQFHPEKSSESGLQLLRNFSLWTGSN